MSSGLIINLPVSLHTMFSSPYFTLYRISLQNNEWVVKSTSLFCHVFNNLATVETYKKRLIRGYFQFINIREIFALILQKFLSITRRWKEFRLIYRMKIKFIDMNLVSHCRECSLFVIMLDEICKSELNFEDILTNKYYDTIIEILQYSGTK